MEKGAVLRDKNINSIQQWRFSAKSSQPMKKCEDILKGINYVYVSTHMRKITICVRHHHTGIGTHTSSGIYFCHCTCIVKYWAPYQYGQDIIPVWALYLENLYGNKDYLCIAFRTSNHTCTAFANKYGMHRYFEHKMHMRRYF